MFNGCVLTGGVGTGKTVTALAYYYTKILGGVLNDWESIKNPIHIYVFTTARKRDDLDWELWGMRFGINNIKYDIPKEAPHDVTLTVDSYNNIGKYTKVHGAFIIFDEQRMVGAGSWSKAFVHLAKSNQWVMLSATPGDKWEDFIPLFVAHGFYKNRTEFKRDHCIYSYFGKFPKLERYVGVNKLIKLKHSILVDMPYERHTKRHIHKIDVEFDKELFDQVVKKRWNPYEERPLRDVAEMFSVMRKVVNSDSSRIEVLRCLMLKHPRLIVFYNFNYELEILRSLASFGQEMVSSNGSFSRIDISESIAPSLSLNTLQALGFSTSSEQTENERPSRHPSSRTSPIGIKDIPSPASTETSSTMTKTPTFAIAEWNGHKHEPVPDTDHWVYLVQYVAGAEAWDCVTTNIVVFYSWTYSYKVDQQAQGRIDRLNTDYIDLNYYRLVSKAFIDKAIEKSQSGKQDFNEKKYGRPTYD